MSDPSRRFSKITAVAAPLLRANVDTDAIIPSREIRAVSTRGLGAGLFAGWRYRPTRSADAREPDPDFVLNNPAYGGTGILLSGANFGCGSSREQAVWALGEYGIRAVIAPSFAPIFFGNCVRNGLLPARLDEQAIARLVAATESDPQRHRVTIDLTQNRISVGEEVTFVFEIDTDAREALLSGADPIAVTLQSRAAIEAYVTRDRIRRPWVYLASPP